LFQPVSSEQAEILVAQLSEIGFEGFEEEGSTLKAFVAEKEVDEEALQSILAKWNIQAERSVIRETNWNETWESGFQPVVVDDFVAVRAHFHQPNKAVQHEVIITPKMSFGTGHHATTYMMIRQMKDLSFSGKLVLDFGTGTGILAILAAKLGARRIVAIDHDEWSITNCRENILQNNVTSIELQQADSAACNEQFDIILANINKNVILDNLPVLAQQLLPDGILILSGLLAADQHDILQGIQSAGLQLQGVKDRHNWLSMKVSH